MREPDRIEIKNDGTHYFLDRKEVSEKRYRKRHPLPKGEGVFMTASAKAWPRWSDSVGCHPADAQAFMDNAARLGVPTVFSKKDGRVQFTSRDHQRRYCQAIGKVNFDDNWSGKGPVEPPPPPKKRPKFGKLNQHVSREPPTLEAAVNRMKKRSRSKSR